MSERTKKAMGYLDRYDEGKTTVGLVIAVVGVAEALERLAAAAERLAMLAEMTQLTPEERHSLNINTEEGT